VQALFTADAIAPVQVWVGVTQLGTVVAGSARFVTEDDAQELGVGATYRLLSNRPHKVEVGPEGAVLIECFCPTREDWAGLPAVLDHVTRWPVGAAVSG
jgi:hypothetical protein